MDVILCPYCIDPIPEDTVTCPSCGQDTTRDAKLEWSHEKYRNAERKTCRCGASIMKLATICPRCRQKQ